MTPLHRTDVAIAADPRRVGGRLFLPGQEQSASGPSRAAGVVARCSAMPDDEAAAALADVRATFAGRHRDLDALLRKNFRAIAHLVPDAADLPEDRRLLVGSYFTREVAVEAAALFNPSIVPHPVQDAADGGLRFVMSARAVSEGHVSAIVFRSGTFTPGAAGGGVRLDPPSRFVEGGDRQEESPGRYAIWFPRDSPLAERTLFPEADGESHGVEDARFVRLTEDDGSSGYAATYTAFDGARVSSRRLDTDDFRGFRSSALTGVASANKGMALFPRRVGGRYLALSRWDRENNAVASSADGYHWGDVTGLQTPSRSWELIQLGNCGPPIETERGWLVLTHGVGPMRGYALGALLLDLDDPSRVVGRLREPLLRPEAAERDGYVPNVVYSCGALLHGQQLLLPYGCSDISIRFAVVDVPRLLDLLVP